MILVTGATGFTGKYVVAELRKRNIPFKCLVRDINKAELIAEIGDDFIYGNINDSNVITHSFKECSGLINIVSFKDINIDLLLGKAKKANLDKVLFISTTAIFTKLPAESKSLREKIEQKIKESKLNWTILRPTMIYGMPGDRNMERLIKVVNKFPIHPILGSGNHLLQPIHVTDLAKAIVTSYQSKKTFQKAYNLSGKEPLSYRNCVKTIAERLCKKIIFIPLPKTFSYYLAEICLRIPFFPNIKGEQVLRLNENKNFSHSEAEKDFNFSPLSFNNGIEFEIKELTGL